MSERFTEKLISLNVASSHASNSKHDEDTTALNKPITPPSYALLPEEIELLNNESPIKKKTNFCQKYAGALKVFLPFRFPRKDKSKLPSNEAGLISFFSLSWLTKLMFKAYKQGIQLEDLWDLQDEDCAANSCARIQRLWSEEQNKVCKDQEPRLWKAVWRSIRTRILMTCFISLLTNVLQFLGPSILLKLILDYINESEVDYYYGTCIAIVMLCVNILRGALFNLMFVIGTHTAARVTGGIQSLIYRKILKLKTGGEKLSAQLINIISNDTERVFDAVISSVFLTASPVLFLLSAFYCVYVIGPYALIGMGCYLLFYPIMAAIAKGQSQLRLKTVKKTDKRIALMNEILNSLRLIKMYAWEDPFSKKISDVRQEELKMKRIGALLQAVSMTIVPSISILATISTLLGYTLAGYPLKSSEAFTIFSVFNAMQFTVGVLPLTIRNISEAKISLARVQKLLGLPEHKKQASEVLNSQISLSINNATFAWEIHSINLKAKPASSSKGNKKNKIQNLKSSKGLNSSSSQNSENEVNSQLKSISSVSDSSHTSPDSKSTSKTRHHVLPENESVEIFETLFDLNLSVEKAKLVGICGNIGSGKSSLASAICGDMMLCEGRLQINGSLALVTQLAWIYNSTLRENILVGLPYDEEWYQIVVESCSLLLDFNQLPNGDLTEIGEKGINLSGGQKQRVNLARAVYSNRDIYLLDDPLSAVDTKVANHLFNKCIKEVLANKTVLLISHGVHFLEKCDEVILMKEGRISERGSHSELMETKGDYYDLMGYNTAKDSKSSNEIEIRKHIKESENTEYDGSKSDGKLIKEETKRVGSVSGKVYLTFIKVCGGWFICTIVFLVVLLFTLFRIFNVVWLQIWLDDGDDLEDQRNENITLYNATYSDDQLKGDITQNPNLWMYQLVYGLSFFFLIGTGIVKGVGVTFRVLSGSSRLHQDMFNSILRSPMSFLDTTPKGRILNRFSRDVDEIDARISFNVESVLQGMLWVFTQIVMVCAIFPIFSWPLAVVMGIFVWIDSLLNSGIREMKRVDNILKSPVIQHLTASISGLSIIRTFDREQIFINRFHIFLDKHSAAHLVCRIASRWFTYRMDLTATFVTFAITVICVFTKGTFSTAIAGLALSTVNGVCGYIPFLMKTKSELQARLTCVERLMEYAYTIESEAPKEIEATKPPPSWPSLGAIEIHDIKMKYRPELPLVLHGITASIKPSEKIGIVGRTGAGKTSLVTALLRMVELESGSIKIDGVDISVIGLHSLRSAISVIPQDPVLFKGTIRYNLDPFDEHSDEAVWTALERAHLKANVNKQSLKLHSEVEASGENFSVGERQLMCLARALLRNSKILLLDEATASVDLETDQLIQDTIREAFVHCTVLTVAHRLDTIVAYDRILVLDVGKVIEFDSPSQLMQTEGSVFKDMMAAVGIYTLNQQSSIIEQ